MREFEHDPSASAFFVGNVSIDIKKQRYSLGGSAFNCYRQYHLLDGNGELHAAVGGDDHGKYVLNEIRTAGMRDRGIVEMHDLSTLVYTQIDNGDDDVIIEKSPNAATDAHTTEMLLEAMPKDLADTLVYIAGSTRKPSFMDEVFKLENLLDELSDRGATLAVDPGRTPEPGTLRYHRAQTLISHPNNLARVDFWGMNEAEFAAYLAIQENEKDLLNGASERHVKELVDRYIMDKAAPALVCITLGKNGLFLYSQTGGSTLITVPAVSSTERMTTIGLGDSTKAGMIAAIMNETGAKMSPDILANLSVEQLRRIGAFGSAVSTHRMTTETYGRRADIAATIDRYNKHFAEYGITPDYLA